MSLLLKAFLSVFLLLLFSVAALAQPRCSIIHYTTEDGLADNRIQCITKDKEGFMWMATPNGISRFDGHQFVLYKPQPGDRSVLKNNRINKITEDQRGFLWLKSSEGLVYRFDKKTEQYHSLQSIIKDTLPGKRTINYVNPTADGSVWLISKDHGLFRLYYDKADQLQSEQYAFVPGSKSRLPSNDIRFFYPDAKGRFWIGTTKGLVVLAKQASGSYSNMAFPQLPIQGYLKHYKAAGNDIWFAGENGYLVHFTDAANRFSTFKIADKELNGLYVSAQQQTVYSTTSGGILKRFSVQDGKIETFQMPGEDAFKSVTGDASGNIFIEPAHSGIIRFDPVTQAFTPFVLKASDAEFANNFKGFETFTDKENRLWAMMKGSGFGYYDTATRSINYFYNDPTNPLRLFPNSVNQYFYDAHQGVLWLGTTESNGLYRIIFHEKNFNQTLLVTTDDRSANEVRGICTDHRNRLWMGTKAGTVYVLKDGIKQAVKLENTPTDGLGLIYCIMEDRANNIWIGTKNKGLYKAEPLDNEGLHYRLKNFQTNANDSSISSNKIYALLEDLQGRIWVGTFEKGLDLVQEKEGTTFFLNVKNTFKNYPAEGCESIRHLALDATGKIWIGTTEGLLIMGEEPMLKNKTFKAYNKVSGDKYSLGDNDIIFIYKDRENNMWLSTTGGGLNKAVGSNSLKALTFENYSGKDGLASDHIVSCTADAEGNLWLAMPNGLSRFDGHHFRNFNSYDGLATNGFSEASCTRLTNGDLVFGIMNGYLQFSPTQVKDHKIKTDIAFTHLQVNNTDIHTGDSSQLLPVSINETDRLILQYNQNIISIDYAVLDYRFRSNGLYAYRLVGFDKDWQNNKNARRASYTNLPPGDYVFEVKSLNTDRYSNAPIKKLAITILPPPWKTGWAYLIYTVLAGLLLLVVFRILKTMLRLRHRILVEQKMAALKMRFYTHVSHELRTPLTLIQGPVDEIAKSEPLTKTGREHVWAARKNLVRMSRFINQLLDFEKVQHGKTILNVSHTDVVLLVRQVTEFFLDALSGKKIEIKIQADTSDTLAWIDAEKIETVLYNLLSNAMKFSLEGGNISMQIKESEDKQKLVIAVSDEGPGVALAELEKIFQLYYESHQTNNSFYKGSGIGLSLSKEFIELHHGSIYAKNNSGKGLTVFVELQKGKEHFGKDEIRLVKAPVIKPALVFSEDNVCSESTQEAVDVSNQQLVLLVEDNSELSDFVARQLRTVYQVEIAYDGLQGLEKANSLLPDLIVSDIMMPNMDGITMLDQLKKSPNTSHIPIVLLSARYDINSQIKGLQYGADYYITKPFSTDFLKASISNLLEQRKKLFGKLQDGKKAEQTPVEIVLTSQDETFLKTVIQFVEDGMQESEFEIEEIATSVNMSRSAFYKKFRSLTNMAPVEFVNEMRLKKAKQLLDSGEQNISDVSFAVGFSSPKYFSTSFKKYYQCSPSEYLKKGKDKVN